MAARAEARGIGAGAAVVAATTYVLARVVPDVGSRPVAGDEALAGLIAAEPLWEGLKIVMWERGGAPLHFVLAHATLGLDPSVEALRWLSVIFAVLTIPLCYDLGRRLGGAIAGVSAAVVAAGSGTLLLSGAFGRMYTLFAFASALAADLFVRALDARTPGSVYAAAAAAWLLPAIHPYGAAPVAALALVGLALWRGRPLLPALPVLAIGLALVPLAWADLQFRERFDVTGSAGGLVEPSQVSRFALSSLGGYAGQSGWTFVAFVALALAGAIVLIRRRPSFVAFTALALAIPPLALLLVGADSHPSLSARHMIYGLPLWAALIGVAVGRLVAYRALAVGVAGVATVALLAAVSPSERSEERDPSARQSALAAPAAWLAEHVEEGDALFPYSPVYLAALPAARRATVLFSRGPGLRTDRALDRVDFPVARVHVTVLAQGAAVDLAGVHERLGAGFTARRFGAWILVEARGPFRSGASLITAAHRAVGTVRTEADRRSMPFRHDVGLSIGTLCEALRDVGRACVPAR